MRIGSISGHLFYATLGSIQVMEELEESEPRLIGEILSEKQYLTATQIRQVLRFLRISEKLIPKQSSFGSICHMAIEEAVFDSGLKQF